MSRRRTKNVKKTSSLAEQDLTTDYWEGHYAIDESAVAECTDTDGTNAHVRIHSLRNGELTGEIDIPFSEGSMFSAICDAIRASTGMGITMRISDTASTPDRYEEIERVLSTGDYFEIQRVRNLVRSLKRKGINVFGGRIGGTELYDGGYGGFYLLADGKVLLCRECTDWEEKDMDRIVDGVAEYYVLEPSRFGYGAATRMKFGYLQGDRFSELEEKLYPEHGKVTAILGLEGDEVHALLSAALEGNMDSAAIASHRLRINLCIQS